MAPTVRSRHLVLLFALYFCQGLPGGFLAVVFPVVLREQGLSLASIGFASFLGLPWLAKVLWAPLVDRFGSSRFGRRKSWLIPAQLGMLLVTLGFVGLRPEHDLMAIAALFLLLNLFAATQDIAADAWAVDILDDDTLGQGNGAQIGGFKVGNLVGGGVLLALLGVIGWSGDFLIMAALIFAVMVLAWTTAETDKPAPPPRSTGEVLRQLMAALAAQGLVFWAFVFMAKFGESFGGDLIKPMLVDNGIRRETIGLIDGLGGGIATVLGAVAAALVVRPTGGASRCWCSLAFKEPHSSPSECISRWGLISPRSPG